MGRGNDGIGIKLVQGLDIAEDCFHLPGKQCKLILTEGQTGESGNMFDIGSGDTHRGTVPWGLDILYNGL